MKRAPKLLRTVHQLRNSKDIYLEIGSSRARVKIGNSLVFDEPSCIAVNPAQKKVLALGNKAYGLLGKRRKGLDVVFPVKNGAVAHLDYFQLLIEELFVYLNINSAWWQQLSGRNCYVALSSALSPVEQMMTTHQLEQLRVGRISFLSAEIATAQRTGRVNPESADSYCLINMGGMVTSVAIVQRGELVIADRVFLGGMQFTSTTQHILMTEEHCAVSWYTAERVKQEIGCVNTAQLTKNQLKQKMSVQGKDITTQLGKTAVISAEQLARGFEFLVEDLGLGLKHFFTRVPTELVTNSLQNGVLLTGGGSQLPGLREWLQDKLQAEIILSDTPVFDVIDGLNQLAEKKA